MELAASMLKSEQLYLFNFVSAVLVGRMRTKCGNESSVKASIGRVYKPIGELFAGRQNLNMSRRSSGKSRLIGDISAL